MRIASFKEDKEVAFETSSKRPLAHGGFQTEYVYYIPNKVNHEANASIPPYSPEKIMRPKTVCRHIEGQPATREFTGSHPRHL